MHLLYADETNLDPAEGDFFVYGGLVVPGDKAKDLSDSVEKWRMKFNLPNSEKLKFKPPPKGLSHGKHIELKQGLLQEAVNHGCILLSSVTLHQIARSPDIARRYAINSIAFHFDQVLHREKSHGLVLIDRFSDSQIDAQLRDRFALGVVNMPYSSAIRLNRILGFHYSSIGQSHFPSLIDIALGSLRFAVNAFTKNDQSRLPTGKKIMELLSPLFWRPGSTGRVSNLSLHFSPKIVGVRSYREKYKKLRDFFTECGVEADQQILGGGVE